MVPPADRDMTFGIFSVPQNWAVMAVNCHPPPSGEVPGNFVAVYRAAAFCNPSKKAGFAHYNESPGLLCWRFPGGDLWREDLFRLGV